VSAAERPPLDAEELLRRLTRRGVDFVVIGGIAAVLHGSARATFDLDIAFAPDRPNLDALGSLLTELRAKLKGVAEDVLFVPDASTLRRMAVLTMTTPLGELDAMTRPPGAPAYGTLRRRAERYDLGDFTVPVASLEDLIAMKRAAGRRKDLADVDELEAILRLRG